MPEDEKPSIIEALVRAIAQRALGFLNRYVDRAAKRALRMAGLYMAGLVIALIGIIFLATGIVKWLAMMIPSWLAWTIVGIVLLLWGTVLTLATFVTSKG
ncbi:MAG: phage holin family protein [Candidatus Bathyarchaeia archaeon]